MKRSTVPVKDIAGNGYDSRRRRLTTQVRAHRMIPQGRTRGLPRRSRQARQKDNGEAAGKNPNKRSNLCFANFKTQIWGGGNGAGEHKTLMYNEKSREKQTSIYSTLDVFNE
jgi:hypothetical protein